jgi:hypothetical protein
VTEFVPFGLAPARLAPYPGERTEQANVVRSLIPDPEALWMDYDLTQDTFRVLSSIGAVVAYVRAGYKPVLGPFDSDLPVVSAWVALHRASFVRPTMMLGWRH